MRRPYSREICENKISSTVSAPSFKHSSDQALFGSPDLGGWVEERHTHPSGACLEHQQSRKTEGHLPDLLGTTQPADTPLRTPELPGAYLRSRHCPRPLPVYRPASSSRCYRVRGRDPTHPPPGSRSAFRVAQRSCQTRKAKQMIAKPRFCVSQAL